MSTATITAKNNFLILVHIVRLAERRAALLLVLLIMMFASLYLFFLASAVVFAVEQKEVRQDIAAVNSRVATLEVDYFKKKSGVTREQASVVGLASLGTKDFVERARYIGQAHN